MKISIDGQISADPKERILAIEAVTRAICEKTGQDPAEGIMMLLTAAAHMTNTYSKQPITQSADHLATALGHAIVAADGFFTLRTIRPSPSEGSR